jgi:hypothetical protein
VTLENNGMCAPGVSTNTLSKTVEAASGGSRPNEELHVCRERPKWARGFISSTEAVSRTSSAVSTEVADPFPCVPDSVLSDCAAVQTISSNPALFQIITFLNVDIFESLQSTHPNRPLVRSVCRSMREGVWLFAVG